MEAPWRRRLRMRWPAVPAPQQHPPRQWTWQFEDHHGSEIGRWTVAQAGSTERQFAAPELSPAWSTGIAVGADFALAGASMADGYVLHELRPGHSARLLYRSPTRFAVGSLSNDETQVCIEHADHGDWYHPALRVLNRDGGTVADLWDGTGLGLWAGAWSPQPSDHRLIVHHQRADLLRPALWSHASGAVDDVQLALPGDVRATWFPQADALLLNHERRGRHELYRYAISDGILSRIDTPPGMIHAAGVQADGRVWYLWDSGAASPELRTETGVIGRPESEVIPSQPYVDVDIDGIQAFLVEPPAPRPHPAIVLLRCNMFDHIHDSYSPVVQSWVDHGFAVVLPNYRGTMGRGRAWRDAVLGNPGLTEMEDLATVYDWIVASGIAEPGQIVLNGESWGGYLTLLALGTQPERWAAGIAEVPMASFVDNYEDVIAPLQETNRAQFGGTPSEVPDRYRRASPITYADQLRAPVMIVAGEHDTRCPIRQIEAYVARLQQLDKPYELYRMDWGHFMWETEERLRQAEAGIAFVARTLGTAAPYR